ncbi:hypothetical protein BU24DRAFT_80987 [Aaosphaeria arxii CBS 175.79]|uniref:Uncharacterized protein n=1 Tax=Aaosphaeria arxii CBS 175.79 TaxID=1450172 RepID=A0A6A5X9S9_9PLEO|nr:uncharacterized protein BU24DRAFT_80987 [Aaosphaeria arxii CBS 175.79]KAF2009693.1 hypothetical protein BU24DRAFT_80987 [Aaosphaeria arxii CBS 175.79]
MARTVQKTMVTKTITMMTMKTTPLTVVLGSLRSRAVAAAARRGSRGRFGVRFAKSIIEPEVMAMPAWGMVLVLRVPFFVFQGVASAAGALYLPWWEIEGIFAICIFQKGFNLSRWIPQSSTELLPRLSNSMSSPRKM